MRRGGTRYDRRGRLHRHGSPRAGSRPVYRHDLTGGTPLTAHGLDEMHERVHAWFKTPKLLREAARDGRQWDVCRRGEKPEVSREASQKIAERLQGTFFGAVGEVLESGITSLADLEMAVQIALVMPPPFQFMNEIGSARALELVQVCKKIHPDFPVPESLVRRVESGEPWEIPYVLRRDEGDVAILVIRRPQVLNALNQDVFSQIDRHIASIEEDDGIQAVVITGFGRKAFVSGADVSMGDVLRFLSKKNDVWFPKLKPVPVMGTEKENHTSWERYYRVSDYSSSSRNNWYLGR